MTAKILWRSLFLASTLALLVSVQCLTVSAATCPGSPSGTGWVAVNTAPTASSCIMFGEPPPNISGDATDVFLLSAFGTNYETIAYIPAAGGTVNGFNITILGDKSGTFNATGVTGFANLVLGLKDGNLGGLQWGVFLLGELTGTWGLFDSTGKLKDLSHAVLYGIPAPVPLPGALLLFGTVMAGYFGFDRWRKRFKTAVAA